MTNQAPDRDGFAAALRDRLASLDLPALRQAYLDHGEFLSIDAFLPDVLLRQLLAELAIVSPRVHRSFIPGYKKSGSISRFELDAEAPTYAWLYGNPDLRACLAAITGGRRLDCPADDPHTYALYFYTEPGDHIGFHYDTSYYRGVRYTVLLGLVDESSAKLQYELHRTDPARQTVAGEIALNPGRMVVFNGDRLWHRITPLGANERRIALTLEFVTDPAMHPFRRFVSNMKDAIAYFGFRRAFGGRGRA